MTSLPSPRIGRGTQSARRVEDPSLLAGWAAFVGDIEMPGAVDGFGLANWIREHRPEVDVLLAGTVPRAVRGAKDLCEEGPVPNPYDAQVVHNRIRRLLASRKAAGKP